MKLTALALGCALLILAGSPVEAAHCRRGQIYRVHMRTCVSVRSPLAHVAFRHYHRVRFTDLERDTATPRRHRRPRHVGAPEPAMLCDPLTQCGDPVEDRVPIEAPTATPRAEVLPDAFAKSVMHRTPRPAWSAR
jgi:hypothetical protein